MSDLNLTQIEADNLISMVKIRINDESWEYPDLGGAISITLTSKDKTEHFLLDIGRSKIELQRGKYQNRARQVIVLVRLDFGGSPHRNPYDHEITCPHLHIYRQGYGDKWAFPAPLNKFPHLNNAWETLHDFNGYCNIIEPPIMTKGLFT